MLRYEPVTAADLDKLTEFYEVYLNGGQIVRDELRDSMAAGGYMGVKCVADDGRVAGMATVKPGIDFTIPRHALERELRHICGDRKVYTGDMTVVLPEFRKMGVSHELSRQMINAMRKIGVEMFLTELWIHPSGYIPAENLYAPYGHAVYSQDISHFYKDIGRMGITCPICGINCVCGARVTLLDISEVKTI